MVPMTVRLETFYLKEEMAAGISLSQHASLFPRLRKVKVF